MSSYSSFIERYRTKLYDTLRDDTLETKSRPGGIPRDVLTDIWSCNPVSAFIPKAYGGRGGHVHEALGVLETSSYERLSLSLLFGINHALFLSPLCKFGAEPLKQRIFSRFLKEPTLGGLMITEPDYGTDALNMQTGYQDDGDSVRIRGTKHWNGLTGQADYWLIAARRQTPEGQLMRDIGMFVADSHEPDQRIMVDEIFDASGLHLIQYGRNLIDVRVPASQRLIPKQSGVRMLLEVFLRSRMQFCGMAMGFLRRLADEAYSYCQTRQVGKKPLLAYDQVQARVGRMQALATLCSAMCLYASEHAGLDKDIFETEIPANTIKAVVTDYMQESAQSLMQLAGASGYVASHLASQGIIDSRPFQIFEGSNDVLYQQICGSFQSLMKKAKTTSLGGYLRASSWHRGVTALGHTLFDFALDEGMSQRKQVLLGQIVGRAITADWLVRLADGGFRADLIDAAILSLRRELSVLIRGYSSPDVVSAAEDYNENSGWLAAYAEPSLR